MTIRSYLSCLLYYYYKTVTGQTQEKTSWSATCNVKVTIRDDGKPSRSFRQGWAGARVGRREEARVTDGGGGYVYACVEDGNVNGRACDEALSLELSGLVKKRTIPFLRYHLQGGPGRRALLE